MKINHLLFDQDNVLQSKYTKSEVKRFLLYRLLFLCLNKQMSILYIGRGLMFCWGKKKKEIIAPILFYLLQMMTWVHIYQASRERNLVITGPGLSEWGLFGPTLSCRSNRDLQVENDGTKQLLNCYCSQGTFTFCLYELIIER